MFALITGASLLWAPVAGIFIDRFHRLACVCAALLVAGIGYTLLGLQVNPFGPLGYLGAVLVGVGQMSVILTVTGLLGQETPIDVRGSVIGFASLCGAVGILATSFAGGYIYDHWMISGPVILTGIANLAVFGLRPRRLAEGRPAGALRSRRSALRRGPGLRPLAGSRDRLHRSTLHRLDTGAGSWARASRGGSTAWASRSCCGGSYRGSRSRETLALPTRSASSAAASGLQFAADRLVPLWQMVGLWRCGARRALAPDRWRTGRVVQVTAFLFTVLITMRGLVFGAEQVIGARVALALGPYSYTVSLLHDGREIAVNGGLGFGVADAVRALLLANPGVRRIRLDSGGGALSEATRLRAVIMECEPGHLHCPRVLECLRVGLRRGPLPLPAARRAHGGAPAPQLGRLVLEPRGRRVPGRAGLPAEAGPSGLVPGELDPHGPEVLVPDRVPAGQLGAGHQSARQAATAGRRIAGGAAQVTARAGAIFPAR